jgi:hypothetical protein
LQEPLPQEPLPPPEQSLPEPSSVIRTAITAACRAATVNLLHNRSYWNLWKVPIPKDFCKF